MGRLRLHGALRYQDAAPRSARGPELDLHARLPPRQPVPSEPGHAGDRALSAPAQDHRQRSAPRAEAADPRGAPADDRDLRAGPDARRDPRHEGIRQPSVGQVVGRQPPLRRLHCGNDTRRSAAWRPSRGQRARDRPPDDGARLRLHRKGRREAFLHLVRSVSSSYPPQSSPAHPEEVRDSDAAASAGALLCHV